MIKKMMLLASMALAAMAFAIPAMASANGAIQHVGGPTAANGTEIDVTGTVSFTTGLGGFSGCVLHATLVTENGGQTGSLPNAQISITQSTCVGTGSLVGCKVESAIPVGDWHVDVNTHDLTITNVFIDGTNNAGCLGGAGENIDLEFPSITLTPAANSGTSLDNMTVTGEGTAILGGTTETPAAAGGTIGAVEGGTWQIETL